jgi:hypothetical protein
MLFVSKCDKGNGIVPEFLYTTNRTRNDQILNPDYLAQEVYDIATRPHYPLHSLDNYEMQMTVLNNQVERSFRNMKPYFILQPKMKIDSVPH